MSRRLTPPPVISDTPTMPSIDTPNRPMVTYRSADDPPPPDPLYINTIAAIIATIGSIISACVQVRPDGVGISGGASRTSSPDGISGAGPRGGRRTTIVAMSPILLAAQAIAGRLAASGRNVLGMTGTT